MQALMNKLLGEEERKEIDSSEQSLRTIEEEIAFVHTNVTFPEFKRYETVLRIPAEETETVSTMRAEYFEDYYLPKKEQLFFSDISKYVQTDEAFVELFLSTLAIETDESNEENEYVQWLQDRSSHQIWIRPVDIPYRYRFLEPKICDFGEFDMTTERCLCTIPMSPEVL